FQSLEANGRGRIGRGRPRCLGSGCGNTIRERCDLARTNQPLAGAIHDHVFVLPDSADSDLIVRTDANRLPVGTVARLVVIKDLDGRVADDVIENRRRSSFSLVFIAAPLKAGDDLPDLLSSFPK